MVRQISKECAGKCEFKNGEWKVVPCFSRAKDGDFCGKHAKVGHQWQEEMAGKARICKSNYSCVAILKQDEEKRCRKCLDRDNTREREAFAAIVKVNEERRLDANSLLLICVQCKKEKAKELFIESRGNETNRCPDCLKKNQAIDEKRSGYRDRVESSKEYESRPETKEKRVQWKLNNPEKSMIYCKQFRIRRMQDPEFYRRSNERMKKWRAENLEKAREYERHFNTGLAGRLSTYKTSAKQKSIPWDLSKEEALAMFQAPCFYCERVPTENDYNGIDRLYSDWFYTAENCRPCCTACNFSKGAMHPLSYVAQCARIVYFADENPDAVQLFQNVPYRSENGCKFSNFMARVKAKNWTCELTREDYDRITRFNCYLCNEFPPIRCGIDRLDDALHYVKVNCRPCCATCNYMKRNESYESFINRCRCVVGNFIDSIPFIPDPPANLEVERARMAPSMFVPPHDGVKLTGQERRDIIAKERIRHNFAIIDTRIQKGTASDEDIAAMESMQTSINHAITEAMINKKKRLREEDDNDNSDRPLKQ